MATYICDQCGKTFTLGTNLSRHKQVHVKGKYSCNICDLKFSSTVSLEQHRRSIHAIVETFSGFCCETCGKSFTEKKKLVEASKDSLKSDF